MGCLQLGLGIMGRQRGRNLVPYSIPWNQAVVFNKLQTRASGNSALSLALGGWHFGYKRVKVHVTMR